MLCYSLGDQKGSPPVWELERPSNSTIRKEAL